MSTLEISLTSAFKRDYKLMKKKGMDISLLTEVITMLASGEPLPARYRDHERIGRWVGFRECHIQPNWLLVYRIENNLLVLTLSRTGTHSDLFR